MLQSQHLLKLLQRSSHRAPASSFTTSARCGLPLQPEKSRKTTPFRHPRRPQVLDAADHDPGAARFRLARRDDAVLVVREPKSLLRPEEVPLGKRWTLVDPTAVETTPSYASALPPALDAAPPAYPPDLNLTAAQIAELRSLRAQADGAHYSVAALARKFGIPKLAVMILTAEGDSAKEIQTAARARRANQEEKRWERKGPEAKIRWEEKQIRKTLW